MTQTQEHPATELATGIDQDPTDLTPKIKNTKPTQDELRAQVEISYRQIATPKQPGVALDVYEVGDGFAYRPCGSPESAPYEWSRVGDLLKHYDIYRIVDTGPMFDGFTAVVGQREEWKARALMAVKCMGKKSFGRFKAKMARRASSAWENLEPPGRAKTNQE